MSNDKLPTEVLEHVFELLINNARFRDYRSAALVCRAWHNVLATPYFVKLAKDKLAERCVAPLPSGGIYHYRRLANGALHGRLLVTDSKGVALSTNYRSGKPHGSFYRHHLDSRVAEVINYREGVVTGEQKTFDTQGNLIKVNRFDAQGREHGEQEEYCNDLHLMIRSMRVLYYSMEHGKREGAYERRHFLSGSLLECSHYHGDKLEGEREMYYDPLTAAGQLRERAWYRAGQREGLTYEYNPDGTLYHCSFYCGGQLQGERLEWHANGYLAANAYFRLGLPWGRHRTWYENGLLHKEINFLGGTTHGDCTEYHDNGQMALRCCYYDGKLHGLAVEWSTEGIKTRACHYEYGALQGECRDYHDNGTPKVRALYRFGRLHGLYEAWSAAGVRIAHCYYRDGQLEGDAFAPLEEQYRKRFSN